MVSLHKVVMSARLSIFEYSYRNTQIYVFMDDGRSVIFVSQLGGAITYY